MAITKSQKQKIVEDLRKKIEKQKAIVFLDFTGLKAQNLLKIRKESKRKDCELKVAKKTLIQLVLKEGGIDADKKNLSGEVALGIGYKDEISPFKTFFDFTKENEKLKIIGGVFEGKIIEKEKAIALAQLPTREELLAKAVGSFRAPLSGLVGVLQGNLRNLIYVLTQLEKVKS